MRVVLVNAVEATGGAARAAHRLYSGLKAKAVDVRYFTKEKQSDDPGVIAFQPEFDAEAVMRRTAAMQQVLEDYQSYERTRQPDIEVFSHPALDQDQTFMDQLPVADVYNLHWVAGFLEYPVFFGQGDPRPVVWTLHDQGPFTGGCHYDDGCSRFADRCGQCPQLGSQDPQDLSARNLAVKQSSLTHWPQSHLHIVTPSQWLAQQARESALFGRFDVSCIPNSIDTDQFVPLPTQEARRALGLPENGVFLLFVANQIKAKRKGFSYLLEALRQLPNPEGVTLLCVGDDHIDGTDSPVRIAPLDYVGDDQAMAHLYAAADVTLLPSIQDNLPNTMLESLSCGTPVVGFDVGGIPDAVIPGKTGFLAEAQNASSLAKAINEALSDMERLEELGQHGRDHVMSTFTLDHQAEAYAKLFDAMSAVGKTSPAEETP